MKKLVRGEINGLLGDLGKLLEASCSLLASPCFFFLCIYPASGGVVWGCCSLVFILSGFSFLGRTGQVRKNKWRTRDRSNTWFSVDFFSRIYSTLRFTEGVLCLERIELISGGLLCSEGLTVREAILWFQYPHTPATPSPSHDTRTRWVRMWIKLPSTIPTTAGC